MKRLVSRLATLAIAVPLTLAAVAGSAQANHVGTTVPGCYGGGTNATVVCNFTVSVGNPYATYKYTQQVPICAGTCSYVPVTLYGVTSTGEQLNVCYSYTNGSGTLFSDCVDTADAGAILDEVDRIVDENLYVVRELVAEVRYYLCYEYNICR